ncbi:hypothetical protein DYH09_22930 [bacterium CPR1]|nr:hypothetical protein [bacterium CPR1]
MVIHPALRPVACAPRRLNRADRVEELLQSHHREDELAQLKDLRWRAVHTPTPKWAGLALATGGLTVGMAVGLAVGPVLGAVGFLAAVVGTFAVVDRVSGKLAQHRFDRALDEAEARYLNQPAPTLEPALAPLEEPSRALSSEELHREMTRFVTRDDLEQMALKAALKNDHGVVGRLEQAIQARILLGRGVTSGVEVHTHWAYPNGGGNPIDPVFDPQRKILYAGVGNLDKSFLVALNADGEVLWSVNDEPVKGAAALGPGGEVVVRTQDSLRCYSPEGSQLWLRSLGYDSWADVQPAVAADGTTYFLTRTDHYGVTEPNMKLVAIKDGAERWSREMEGDYTGNPQILLGRDGTVWVSGGKLREKKGWFSEAREQAYLLGYTPEGGLKHKLPVSSWPSYVHTSLGEGADGTVYACHGETSLTAFGPDGAERWTYRLKGRLAPFQSSSPRLRQGPLVDTDANVYLTTGTTSAYPEGYVIKLDPGGKEVWRVNVQGGLASRPELGKDGLLYVASDCGELLQLTTEGKLLGQTRIGGTSWNNLSQGPNGEIYANTDKKILAFQPDLEKVRESLPRVTGIESGGRAIAEDTQTLVVGGVRLRKARGAKPQA